MGKASGGGGPRIEPPMAPPPFIGTWGRGKKKGLKNKRKKKRKRLYWSRLVCFNLSSK